MKTQHTESASPLKFINFAELSRRVPLCGRSLREAIRSGLLPSIKLPGARRVMFYWDSVQSALLRMQRGGGMRARAMKQPTDVRSFADARLIAAAPDLLSALKNLLQERYVDGDESDQEFDARGNWTCNSPASISARAAIAKARGDQ